MQRRKRKSPCPWTARRIWPVSHDSKWTSEALFNLLDNAVKYTPAGGKIAVSVVLWEMYVEIKVTDTGKGISESNQAAIFQRFYREEEVHEQQGVGIGLYLARNRNAAGRLYQSGFGAGQGFGIFHYASLALRETFCFGSSWPEVQR